MKFSFLGGGIGIKIFVIIICAVLAIIIGVMLCSYQN
jgi:hypothetical protein